MNILSIDSQNTLVTTDFASVSILEDLIVKREVAKPYERHWHLPPDSKFLITRR